MSKDDVETREITILCFSEDPDKEEHEFVGHISVDGDGPVIVGPCEKCMKSSFDEGYNAGTLNGWEDLSDKITKVIDGEI